MGFFVDSLVRLNDIPAEICAVGKFDTEEEACAASKRSIDEFLVREFKSGMNARALFARFRQSGPIPVIFGDPDHTMERRGFNATQYALIQCENIVGATGK